MTKDTTRHLFLVFAISVGLLLPLSFAPLNADEVKYCFRSGPAKSPLAQYDDEVRLLSQQQLIDAEHASRTESFRTDPRLTTEQSASCEDYAKQRTWVGEAAKTANYYQARGHSAPDSDFRHTEARRVLKVPPRERLFGLMSHPRPDEVVATLDFLTRVGTSRYGL